MRVVLAQHLTDDTRALAVLRRRSKVHVAHGIDDATVNRLEPIAYVGDRAIEQRIVGVLSICVSQFLGQLDRLARLSYCRGLRFLRRNALASTRGCSSFRCAHG